MKKWLTFCLLRALLSACFLPAGACGSREELREAFRALTEFDGDTPYAEGPRTQAPYGAGGLDEGAMNEALDWLNFLRALAGLEPVERSRIYDYQCQRGAVLVPARE